MKKILFSTFLVIGILAQFNTASAVVFEGNEQVVLDAVIDDDLYLSAGSATIKSNVNGDLYIIGGSVIINGDVSEDLVVMGGKVDIFGNVGGDVRVLAGQLVINGSVGDDLLVYGGSVDVAKTSTVGGTVVVGAGALAIKGTVKEDVRGIAGLFVLDGTIERNVSLNIQDSMSISEKSKIKGNFNYSSLIEVEIPKNVVMGKLSFNKAADNDKAIAEAFIAYKGISFLAISLIIILLVIFTPNSILLIGKKSRENVLKSFALGVVITISVIIGSIILMFTVIGIPLALIMVVLFLICLYLSKIAVASWLVSYLVSAKKEKWLKLKLASWMVAFIFLYYVISIIPKVGFIFNILLVLVGIGGLYMVFFEWLKSLRSKNLV